MKKLFLFDVDGTLANSNRDILPSTIKAINAAIEKGHIVGIVTGRNFCQLDEVFAVLPNIKIAASINGGIITDLQNNKQYIYCKPIDREIIQYFIKTAKEIKREFQCSNQNVFYRVYFGDNPKTDISDPIFFKGGTKNLVYDQWSQIENKVNNMDIFHLAIKCEPIILEKILPVIKSKFEHLKIVHIGDASNCYIECDDININKSFAIKRIQELVGISNQDTYYFGDSGNDIAAFKYVHNPIVMGNAKDNIKMYGKYIIGPNDTNAIYDFIMGIINYE